MRSGESKQRVYMCRRDKEVSGKSSRVYKWVVVRLAFVRRKKVLSASRGT